MKLLPQLYRQAWMDENIEAFRDPIARLYADAHIQRIYGGTTEIMKDLTARRLGA